MKKAEQSEATRTALLQAARELFTERGYADTGTEDIAQRAGVTRGALYYQFRDKAGLFYAVVEDLNQSVAQTAVSAIQFAQGEQEGDLWDQTIHAGVEAYLDATMDLAVQRITLIEASAVLSREENYQLDKKYGLDPIRGVLQELMDAGLLAPQPLGALSHFVLNMLAQASLYIAHADDQVVARKEISAFIYSFFDGLRVKN